ncbi:MAG: hypothetical protein AB7E30_03465 [Lawsonibacter sp.]
MKTRLLAGLTALTLLLSGCASLLTREYVRITTHNTTPTAEGDPSVLRAENYQELVNALIYFITQGMETGSVRLYIDSEDVEADLEAACLEVVQEDPLGAYAVDYIKYSVNSIVTYYEADVQITYRRTRQQINSIVSATGTTAIRSELESALADFASERVLRISYFDGDEDYIRTLCKEAYYANPASALDMPDVSVSIYPDSGQQRIVEISLTYHLSMQELSQRRDLLTSNSEERVRSLWHMTGDQLILAAGQSILAAGGYDPEGGSTAYHALLTGGADSQGLALAMALACQNLKIGFQVVEGTLNGNPHFWTVVSTEEGWMHLDLTRLTDWDTPFRTDTQMAKAGYSWDTTAVPQCGQPSEDDHLPSGA